MRTPGKSEAVGLAISMGLFGAGCSQSDSKSEATPNKNAKCSSLTSFRLIGASHGGGENAANTGECVAIYNPDTLKTIGKIATGPEGGFVIKCRTDKPAGFVVETNIVDGRVNVDGGALNGFGQGEYSQIRECQAADLVIQK